MPIMSDSNEMSNHPDDSPNSTKKRAGISEDEGSACLTKGQSKRLKTEDVGSVQANNVKRAVISADDEDPDDSDRDSNKNSERNRHAKTKLYLEESIKLFVNKRTEKLFVDPVIVIIANDKKERMERQEYEELKSSPSASASEKEAVAFPDDTTKAMVDIIRNYAAHSEKKFDDQFKKLIKDHDADLHREEKSKMKAKKMSDLTAKAKFGNPDAMVELARMLSSDDPCQSYLWYKKAAVDHSHLRGMEKAGECMVKGLGTPHDPEGGMKLLEKAAEEGSGIAAYKMGIWYYEGKHEVKPSYRKAKKCFMKAIDNHQDPLDDQCRKQAYKRLKRIEEKKNDDRITFSPLV